jgi:hypothetical protein
VCAKIADAQMNTPVSTGYSTTPPIGWPSSVRLPWTYGKTCRSMSRPIHSVWMSE